MEINNEGYWIERCLAAEAVIRAEKNATRVVAADAHDRWVMLATKPPRTQPEPKY